VDIRDSARFSDTLGIGPNDPGTEVDADIFEIFIIFAASKDIEHA
jgi:hypothetical protein